MRAFQVGAAGLVAYYIGFAAMLLGATLLLTAQWRFSILQAAVSIAPGPITAGIVSPFSARLSVRFGVRGTVAAGAALSQRPGPGRWPLASAGDSPAYAAVVLSAMLLWGWPTRSFSPRCSAVSRRRRDHPADPGPGRRDTPPHARRGRGPLATAVGPGLAGAPVHGRATR